MQPKLDKVRISIDEMYFNKQLTNIQNQLNRLFKDSDFGKYLSSNLKTVSQEISKTVNDTGQQIKRISQKMRNEIASIANRDGVQNGGISDATNFQDTVRDYFKGIENGTVIAECQIGEATTNIFRNEKGKINGFVIEVKNAANETERLFYKLKPIIENNKKIGDEFVYSHSSITDSNIKLQEQAMREAEKASKALQTQIDRNTAAVTNYNNELEITKRKYLDPNASKPINNSGSLDTLQGQYDKVTTAINALGNADKTNFTSLKANVEAEIALLKQMATEFRNAEYAANQLAAKPITVIKENEEQNIKKLKADIQAAKIESQDFLDKVNALSGQLAGVTNKQQLGEYLNTFSTIKAEFQALSSEQKAQEKQARDINNAYKSFESTINKIAKLEAQVAGLDPVKNAGQITELKNKINELYTEASKKQNEYYNTAKKGGIEVDTIINNMDTAWEKVGQTVDTVKAKMSDVKSSNFTSIKGDISNGSLGTSVDTIEAKFRSLNVQSTEVEGNISQLRALLSQMDSSDNIESVTADYEKFKTLLITVTNQVKNLQTEQKQANANQALQNSRTALSSQIDVWLKNNSAAAKQFGAQLREIQSQISTVDETQLRNLRAEFQEVTRQAAIAGQTGKTMAEQFKQSLRTVTSYFSAAALITRMVSTLRTGITTIVELDTALVDLRKTTDATESQLKSFYYTANDTAKQLGVTTQAVIQAAAEWSRLGYSIKDAETMSKTSAIFSSISPNVDIEKATDGLVSAMKAFKIEADDALDGIVSKINAIGNSQAVSNEDIIEFLTRSSSAMKEANNTLDETIALGTAA